MDYVEKVQVEPEDDEKVFEVFKEGVDKEGKPVTYKERTITLYKKELESEKTMLQEQIDKIDEKLLLFK